MIKKHVLSFMLVAVLSLVLTLPVYAAPAEDIEMNLPWLNDSTFVYTFDPNVDVIGEAFIGNLWSGGEPFVDEFTVFVVDDASLVDGLGTTFISVKGYMSEQKVDAYVFSDGFGDSNVRLDDGKVNLLGGLSESGGLTKENPYPFSFWVTESSWSPQIVYLELVDEEYEYLGWISYAAIVFTKSQVAEFQTTGKLPIMGDMWNPVGEREDCSEYVDLTDLKILLSNADVGEVILDAPSTWAAEQVANAISENLVPENLKCKYTEATTRAEFAALAVTLYESLTGEEISTNRSIMFTDTMDMNVYKAATIGVVNGVGDKLFAPDEKLTREQAATMLSRLADALNNPFPREISTFVDKADFSTWAADSIGYVQAAGIMTGVGNNTFSPKADYTREQSIVTILRLFEYLR